MSTNRRNKELRRVEVPGAARYLTFSCNDRQPLLGESDARDLFANQLGITRSRLGFKLLAWVVMPDHVHVLVVPKLNQSVASILMPLKRRVSTEIMKRWRCENNARLSMARRVDGSERFWQAGGGYDRAVIDGPELNEKIRYIHENPVRRGLVDRCEDWVWSSARAWAELDSQWPEIDRR